MSALAMAPTAPPLVHVSRDKRKLAVLATEEVNQLFAGEPTVKVGGFPYRVLHHGPYEVALLKRLGYPAGNPMLDYYDWANPAPENAPFDVQKKTCDLLTLNERAYVLNGMGTGKTKAALWAWDWLRTIGMSKKLIVAAPLSTLKFVWMAEVFSTINHRKACVLHGSRQERLDLLAQDFDIYIINHDGIAVIFDELLARNDMDTLIIDELATYRNINRRSKLMRKLAQKKKFVWGLTGSPMPTAPTDVWMQSSIVTPGAVPKYASHMRDQLMERKSTFVWVPKPNAIEQAFKYMQPAVRYALADVVELPDVVSRNIDVALTAEQKRVYDGIVKHCQALAANQMIDAANAAVAMGKLLQIAGGWVYDQNRTVATLDAQPRMTALIDTIMDCDRKVIVFAPYLHALDGISQKLKDEDILHAVVHGGTTHREEIFTRFQNEGAPLRGTADVPGSFKVLLAHPRCMAHGITLTAADTIIWYLPTMSLEIYEQANARIRRVGQKYKQQIIHLVAAPVERRIYSLLRSRQKVQDKFLGMFLQATQLL